MACRAVTLCHSFTALAGKLVHACPDKYQITTSRGSFRSELSLLKLRSSDRRRVHCAFVANMVLALPATKLTYFEDMWALQAKATVLSFSQTILYPQGGGQPADTGFISSLDGQIQFLVNDVRLKSGIVHHYGIFQANQNENAFQQGQEVTLSVDRPRRELNCRLHSAGHLLDACMHNVGLPGLEPTKGHHFPDGPFVEYKGSIQPNEVDSKRAELESDANKLVAAGGKVRAVIVPYDEAASLCGGKLPDYIPKESAPRVVLLGDHLGCPCGGTHVADISEIGPIKVTSIRVKKGVTKVSYNLQ